NDVIEPNNEAINEPKEKEEVPETTEEKLDNEIFNEPIPDLSPPEPVKYICINTIKEHKGNVCKLTQLKNENIISASYDKSIKLWDSNTLECISTMKEHTNWVTSILELKDGKIVSGSTDNTLRIWDPDNDYNCIKVIKDHTNWVNCLT